MNLDQLSDVELFIEGIYNGTETVVPKTSDELLALSFALIEYAPKADDEQFANLMKYLDTIPNEFGILALKDIVEIKGVANRLLFTPGFEKLIPKYRDLIM
jgi:hypothetical protein